MSLKDDMADDLDIFFDVDDFAENIVYKGNNVPAIVDRLKSPGISAGNVATYAQVMVKKSSVPSIQYLDVVRFDEADWTIELITSADSLVLNLSVRRKEGYSFK